MPVRAVVPPVACGSVIPEWSRRWSLLPSPWVRFGGLQLEEVLGSPVRSLREQLGASCLLGAISFPTTLFSQHLTWIFFLLLLFCSSDRHAGLTVQFFPAEAAGLVSNVPSCRDRHPMRAAGWTTRVRFSCLEAAGISLT